MPNLRQQEHYENNFNKNRKVYSSLVQAFKSKPGVGGGFPQTQREHGGCIILIYKRWLKHAYNSFEYYLKFPIPASKQHIASHSGGPGSNPGLVMMWDFVMDKSGAEAGFLRELRFPLPIYIPSASPQYLHYHPTLAQ
jgi:hypothetical protein